MRFHRLKRTFALTVAAGCLLSLSAGVEKLPVKRINGRLYHYYEVGDKDNIYNILGKLDITREELRRNNPGAAEGLRPGMVLYFPFEDEGTDETHANQSAPVVQATQPVVANPDNGLYEVKRGETIFGISQKFGVRQEDLINANPILSEGLKAGQMIRIPGRNTVSAVSVSESRTGSQTQPAENAQNNHSQEVERTTEGYLVKKGETFYSIAVSHGLSVAALEAANPGVNVLKEGQVLNIPVVVTHQVAEDVAVNVPAQPESNTQIEIAQTTMAEGSETTSPEEVSIAVMLPFMLNEENISKNAARYTEFYKGFLLAADSLRECGVPINIKAYDTEGSVLKIREALSDSLFKRHNLVIAPDNSAQLAVLAEYGRNNGIKVMNTFLVKDDSYLTNPAVMQANLPSQLMYRKVIDALLERLAYSTPVFLNMSGDKGDKADFVAELKRALEAKGQTFMDIEVDNRLTAAQLQALPAEGNYMFIPETSRQADLNRLMPAIIEWRDHTITPTVRLFGYPEWTTFRGETLQNMHNLNTMVFSRFYTDEESWATRGVDAKFRKWYGCNMENAVPRQGLMGFDMGMFVIPYIKNGVATGYDGVQNGYFFTEPSDNAGSYNQALYFINFRPGTTTDKIRL